METWFEVKAAIEATGISVAKVLREANLSEGALYTGLRKNSSPSKRARVRVQAALDALSSESINSEAAE